METSARKKTGQGHAVDSDGRGQWSGELKDGKNVDN